jgi:hypothetical protein
MIFSNQAHKFGRHIAGQNARAGHYRPAMGEDMPAFIEVD